MINIKQMHFTNRFYIFITLLFHFITLQFLARMLGFAEAGLKIENEEEKEVMMDNI